MSDFASDPPAVADRVPLVPIARLLLTPNEAAAALRISPRLLWSLTRSGQIPAVRLGRLVRYSPHALATFIETKITEQRE